MASQPTRDESGRDHKIEGLLFNSRMVQGIFDDLNPETVSRWAYPDTENGIRIVIRMNSSKRCRSGERKTALLYHQSARRFSEGYSKNQPWINSAFKPDGSLRDEYFTRLRRILVKADELEWFQS